MRNLLSIILFSLLSSLSLTAQETPSEFMGKWVESYNKNDAKSISSFYDQSEKTDCLISGGLWRRGFKAISKMYLEDMRDVRFYDSKAENIRSRTIGNTAVVSFIHRFKYEVKSSGVNYRIHIRTTATLLRDNKSWKIISEHSSPIAGIVRAQEIK